MFDIKAGRRRSCRPAVDNVRRDGRQAFVRSAGEPSTRRRLTRSLRVQGAGGGVALGLTAVVLSVVTWPVGSLEPGLGLDPSWMTALSMAADQGLQFGREFIFTYGPLGFLRTPTLAYPWTTRLAFAYTAAIQFGLCLTLLWTLRRGLGSLLYAAAVTLVIASTAVAEPVPVVVFGVSLALARGDVAARLAPWAWAGTGGLVAVQLLAKLNTGITVLAVAAAALLAPPGARRHAGWFSGALVTSLAAGWALSGQLLGTIPGYLSSALQTTSGYSEAMVYEAPGAEWELWAAVILAGIGLALALSAHASSPLRLRLVIGVMWVVLAFTAFKSGFVRHDSGHAGIFFATMLGGFAVLPLADLPRATKGLALLVVAVSLFAALGVEPTTVVAPLGRAESFFSEARLVSSPSGLDRAIARARTRLLTDYVLGPQTLAGLAGHTVQVEPYDAAVVWAAGLRWKPLPAFQDYTAYTAKLDRRNAATYASLRGPERVLRREVAPIDARNPAWESPAAILAMLCHYRAVSTTVEWEVLARVPNRCGPPKSLGVVHAAYNETIPVPRAPGAHSAVYAEIEGAGVGGLERLATLFYRARIRNLAVNGRYYRLVPGTAADGLLLRVAPAADYPAPFALNEDANTLVLTREGGGSGPLVIRYFALRLP